MSTHILASVGRVLLGGAILISTSCGSEMLRTGRSPVYLVVEGIEATAGNGGTPSAFLLSDVQTLVDQTVNGATVQVPTIFNDSVEVTLSAIPKNPTVATTAINAVTLTRYRVAFRRSDGRNTPGVDVPYGFDGGLGVTVTPGSSQQVVLEIVRHQAKLEPPLKNLANFGGQGFISTIAEITFFGRDQNGNEVSVTALLDVQFGDFADE